MAETKSAATAESPKRPYMEPKAELPLPYWLANVPEDQQPAECPEFLLDISDRSKAMINLPQADYHVLTWPEVQEVFSVLMSTPLETNQINKFSRSPVDHRRYLEYMFGLRKEYGSVMAFVRDERLKWTDLKPRAKAFEDPSDLRILYNDWPYGIDPKIVHLCVWTKFELEDDPKTGELMPKMRLQIDEYVDKTFKSRVPVENVIWFKNWNSLKSIHSMEHFHVMLNDPDQAFIKEVTNGDVAVSSQLYS